MLNTYDLSDLGPNYAGISWPTQIEDKEINKNKNKNKTAIIIIKVSYISLKIRKTYTECHRGGKKKKEKIKGKANCGKTPKSTVPNCQPPNAKKSRILVPNF